MATLHDGTSTVESPSSLVTSTSYTNFKIGDIDTYEVSTVSSYQPTHLPTTYPPYVNSARIGITNVKATFTLKGEISSKNR